MRWLWIDRFLEFKRGKSARAVKNLSLAEDYFADHFPGYPVMPACLILEGLAQTGGILVGEANDFQEKVVLAKIVSARFQREFLAGEQLVYETDLVHLRPEGASVLGTRVRPASWQCVERASRARRRRRPIFSSPTWTRRGRSNSLAITTSSSAANSNTCSAWPRLWEGRTRVNTNLPLAAQRRRLHTAYVNG